MSLSPASLFCFLSHLTQRQEPVWRRHSTLLPAPKAGEDLVCEIPKGSEFHTISREIFFFHPWMLRAILNKSWQQHPTRHQLYGHLPPITKTIQVRRTRHAGHCWRSRDELIRDVLLWIPTHGRAKAGRPARTYIQQLCEDTGCCPEDLPRAMNDREEWRERVRDIRAASTIWCWWWFSL